MSPLYPLPLVLVMTPWLSWGLGEATRAPCSKPQVGHSGMSAWRPLGWWLKPTTSAVSSEESKRPFHRVAELLEDKLGADEGHLAFRGEAAREQSQELWKDFLDPTRPEGTALTTTHLSKHNNSSSFICLSPYGDQGKFSMVESVPTRFHTEVFFEPTRSKGVEHELSATVSKFTQQGAPEAGLWWSINADQLKDK